MSSVPLCWLLTGVRAEKGGRAEVLLGVVGRSSTGKGTGAFCLGQEMGF